MLAVRHVQAGNETRTTPAPWCGVMERSTGCAGGQAFEAQQAGEAKGRRKPECAVGASSEERTGGAMGGIQKNVKMVILVQKWPEPFKPQKTCSACGSNERRRTGWWPRALALPKGAVVGTKTTKPSACIISRGVEGGIN